MRQFVAGDRVFGLLVTLTDVTATGTVIEAHEDTLVIRWDEGAVVIYTYRDAEAFHIRKIADGGTN